MSSEGPAFGQNTLMMMMMMMIHKGAKDDWDFRISDLVKNPDGTDV